MAGFNNPLHVCMKECELAKPTETKTLVLCFQTGESFRKTMSGRSAVTKRESREEGEEEKRERGGSERERGQEIYFKMTQRKRGRKRGSTQKPETLKTKMEKRGVRKLAHDGVMWTDRKAPSFFFSSFHPSLC